jgi:antitoxin HigA-1
MKRIPNVTPGEILMQEFLIPTGITAYRLSKDTEVPPTRIS